MRQSKGTHILEDLAHEGTHALDFGPQGVFADVEVPKMMPEEVFIREYRAYMAEKLITGRIPFGSKQALIDHIVREYRANHP